MINIMIAFQTRIGSPTLGIILPAIILGLSILLTYIIIRHFSGQDDQEIKDEAPNEVSE